MFDLDPSLDRIPVSSDAIERVAWSLNLTAVAGTDFGGAEARAYAVTGAAGGGRSVCYVCLYVQSMDRAQVYRYRANPYPTTEGEAHEEEALAFLEDLGFILESIDYRGWSSQERQEWFAKQPPFHARQVPRETPPVPEEPAAAAREARAAEPAAPPEPEAPPEMEGLLVLADSVEGRPPAPSPAPRQAARGAPSARAAAVARASPPPARVPEKAPPSQRPVKVDLPEEYGELARLFASF
ncbi:MAG: hypothetical protein L0214_09625 [candidate division NC10 bacterium]|nr:hypothetical protein [candidate division NC10 bacterium]